MLSDNFGAVFRADYDPVAKTFGNPSIIAGNMNDKSFKEGTEEAPGLTNHSSVYS